MLKSFFKHRQVLKRTLTSGAPVKIITYGNPITVRSVGEIINLIDDLPEFEPFEPQLYDLCSLIQDRIDFFEDELRTVVVTTRRRKSWKVRIW